MKYLLMVFLFFSFLFNINLTFAANATNTFHYGVAGIPDPVPAATLLVPYFEVGISEAENPTNTLIMVRNVLADSNCTVHYEIWDIDGRPVGIRGNFNNHIAASLRDVINNMADEEAKQMLTQGDVYRGFITFDVVSEATNSTPLDNDYPFRSLNALEGRIYYTRLEEGSSNGLNMVHIEDVGSDVSSFLRGFYSNSDSREEIDSEARWCAHQLSSSDICASHENISRIHSRVYMNPEYNGASKIIIFTWSPGYSFGPSRYCDTHDCNSIYVYQHYREASSELVDTKDIRLDHVVNVITVTKPINGMVSIRDIPSAISNFQVYAFSINSASPPMQSNFKAAWDAILESIIF